MLANCQVMPLSVKCAQRVSYSLTFSGFVICSDADSGQDTLSSPLMACNYLPNLTLILRFWH